MPELKGVHSQVLQAVHKRVDLVHQAFFRRVKNVEKPGFPRFKGKGRYDSGCCLEQADSYHDLQGIMGR